jgi:hypothetical protein
MDTGCAIRDRKIWEDIAVAFAFWILGRSGGGRVHMISDVQSRLCTRRPSRRERAADHPRNTACRCHDAARHCRGAERAWVPTARWTLAAMTVSNVLSRA